MTPIIYFDPQLLLIVLMRTRLTPADNRYSKYILGGDADKNNDQLLEHENSLCSHPHECSQSEVMDEGRHSHTASIDWCPVNPNHKHQQHAEDCNAELNVEFCGIFLAKFSVVLVSKEKFKIWGELYFRGGSKHKEDTVESKLWLPSLIAPILQCNI